MGSEIIKPTIEFAVCCICKCSHKKLEDEMYHCPHCKQWRCLNPCLDTPCCTEERLEMTIGAAEEHGLTIVEVMNQGLTLERLMRTVPGRLDLLNCCLCPTSLSHKNGPVCRMCGLAINIQTERKFYA